MSYLCKSCDKIVTVDDDRCPYCSSNRSAAPDPSRRKSRFGTFILLIAGAAGAHGAAMTYDMTPSKSTIGWIPVILILAAIGFSTWGALHLASLLPGDNSFLGIALALLGLFVVLLGFGASQYSVGTKWVSHLATALGLPLAILGKVLFLCRPSPPARPD